VSAGCHPRAPKTVFEVFQIRWTHIELPAIVAMFGLESHGGRLTAQTRPVIPPLLQVAIDGRLIEHAFGGLHMTVGRSDIQGELGPVNYCHCSRCRKANGTAFLAASQVNPNEFKLVSGQDRLGDYESSRS
jgi:Glutathione-dependent formaldehyde-activating enzyme